MGLICSLLIFLGSMTTYIGSVYDSPPVMILGRLLLGLGAESNGIVINTYLVLWFFGPTINIA